MNLDDIAKHDPYLAVSEKPMEMPLLDGGDNPICDESGEPIVILINHSASSAFRNWYLQKKREHEQSESEEEFTFRYAEAVRAMCCGWRGEITQGKKKLNPAKDAGKVFDSLPGFSDEAVTMFMEYKPELPKPRNHSPFMRED